MEASTRTLDLDSHRYRAFTLADRDPPAAREVGGATDLWTRENAPARERPVHRDPVVDRFIRDRFGVRAGRRAPAAPARTR